MIAALVLKAGSCRRRLRCLQPIQRGSFGGFNGDFDGAFGGVEGSSSFRMELDFTPPALYAKAQYA
jgi:hypothetical protein